MTDEDIEAAAKSDPDNPPLTRTQFAKLKRVPLIRRVRRSLGISQETFAKRFGIPLGTLRDWEQGRTEPDAASRSFIKVIERDPKAVEKALES